MFVSKAENMQFIYSNNRVLAICVTITALVIKLLKNKLFSHWEFTYFHNVIIVLQKILVFEPNFKNYPK